MSDKVHFVKQTQREYDSSLKHSPSTLYFTTDTNKMYLGDNEIGGGNSSEFVVMYAYDRWGDPQWTSTKSVAELDSAYAQGKSIKAIIDYNGYVYTVCDMKYTGDVDDYSFSFSFIDNTQPVIGILTHRIYHGEEEIMFEID